MKNFFTKAIVAAGVMASAMALGSVAVLAETITYKVDDYVAAKSITATQSGKAFVKNISDSKATELFSTEGKYVVTTSNKDSFGAYVSQDENYSTVMVSGNNDREVLTVSDLGAGDKIRIYFGASTSKYDSAKASSISFAGEGKTANATGASAFTATEFEYTIEAAGTYTLTNASGARINIYAIEIDPAAKGTGSIAGTIKDDSGNVVDGTALKSTLKCNGSSVTVNADGTYTVPELINGTYTLSYDGVDYELADTEVTVSSQTAATTKNLTFTKKALVPVSNITFTGDRTVNLGYAVSLTATVEPATASEKDVTWSSDDANVVFDKTTGDTVKVRTKAAGSAVIKATAGDVTKEFTLTTNAETASAISEADEFDLKTAAKSMGFGADKEVIANGTVALGKFTVVNTEKATSESTSAIIRSNPFLQIGAQNFSYVEFTTSKAFKVTIPFASTGSSNISDLIILDADDNVVAHETVTGTTAFNLVKANLPAGTYKIASPTAAQGATENSTGRGARLTTITFAEAEPVITAITEVGNGTKVAVVAMGDNSYLAVASVAKADVEKYDSIAVWGKSEVASSSTVYSGVNYDGTTYTAKQLTGSEDNYIYAVRVDGETGITSAIEEAVKGLTTKLS